MLVFNVKILIFLSALIGMLQNISMAQEAIIAPPPPSQQQVQKLPVERLSILKSNNDKITLNVEIARSAIEQARGLMFRTELAEDEGMLFVFKSEAPRRFWMKNTLIPLDMIFIKRNGTIMHIHQNAVPHDLSGVESNGNAFAVLEIPGGVSAKLGLQIGDRVQHNAFNSVLLK